MKLLDLTMELSENTPVFPGDPAPIFEQIETVAENKWNQARFTFNSHFGTHIDAPYHRFEDGKTLDEFPLEQFIGRAVCVDITDINWELIEENDIVLFYTNTQNTISTDVAQKLVQRDVKIVGIDAPSVDDEPNTTHDILLSENILIVENLINLKEVVGKRFECIIAPLKIKDGDGAPCRIIARIEDE